MLRALLCLALCFIPALVRADVTVFAAASLKTALDEVAASHHAVSGLDSTISYAGSSVLARQIERGAPADIFLSANTDWMDRVQGVGLVVPGTRRDLLRNRLVLIAHEEIRIDLAGDDLSRALGDGRLAMALVDAVPAGLYGKAALDKLGLWDSVASRVAQADNVRAALALVALGEAPLGVVYATDAMADPRVHVAAIFPEDSHPPIVYPVAALRVTPESGAFLAFLQGATARTIFEARGFTVLVDPQ